MKKWFTAAAMLTLASVAMGALVCATESGAACPTWPGCYPDQFTPAVALNPMIEFLHRVIAGVTGPVVLVAALMGRRLADRRPRRLAWIGLGGTLLAGLFGMLTVKVGIPWWLGILDLFSALAATVALLVARLLLTEGVRWAPGRTARLAASAVVTLTAMHLLALAVAGNQSFTRCMSWPLGVLPLDRWPGLQWLRLGLALASAALIVAAAWRAGGRPRLWGYAAASLAALAAELGLGVVMLAGAGGIGWRAAYSLAAVALYWLVALLAARASLVPAGQGEVHSSIPGSLQPISEAGRFPESP